ncbi:hypothetical protein D6C78_07614 [Aureobasidium pullulans]|uniref:P-loop containing nucleoside triphosphate hydrolase protein n=1 Tax=Aureobasidium pullulans TaxID=5580 RepID=A0A4T0BG84_AURPU|nr:hypothetical protein D6C78_07614 [Aureobasidium pullulans]
MPIDAVLEPGGETLHKLKSSNNIEEDVAAQFDVEENHERDEELEELEELPHVIVQDAIKTAEAQALREQSPDLIDSFGLKEQADTLVGTRMSKGISGGQKRRVSVASQLITAPNILFLDEPTSGLDSVASFEVVSLLKKYAQKHKLIVVINLHQLSNATFQLFDKLLLLSQSQICYFGPVSGIASYFSGLGLPVPKLMNLSEHILELTDTDFDLSEDEGKAAQRILIIQSVWRVHGKEDHIVAFDHDKTFLILVMWLFLDLVAAESLVVLVACLFTTFIIAFALVAFVNGLWMSVGGFLVPTSSLDVLWCYAFHYIDY